MLSGYEDFRRDISSDLLTEYSFEEVDNILKILDRNSVRYAIRKKDVEVINYVDSFGVIIKYFIDCKTLEGRSSGTTKLYNSVLNMFRKYINKPIESIESNDIRYFLMCVKSDRHIGDNTLDSYRTIVTNFFRWAYNEGYVNNDFTTNVKRIKYEYNQRCALTLIELEKCRSCCYDIREKLIFEVLYSTGCRVSELVNISINDIDFDERTVRVLGKGRKYRTVFLNAKAMIIIREYLNSLDRDPIYLFETLRRPHKKMGVKSIQNVLKDISDRADIGKNVTPHILRHTMATIALSNGMKIEYINKILGHAKLDTTMIYAKLNTDDIKVSHSKCVL